MTLRDLFSTANAEALGFVAMVGGGAVLIIAALAVAGYILYRLVF